LEQFKEELKGKMESVTKKNEDDLELKKNIINEVDQFADNEKL